MENQARQEELFFDQSHNFVDRTAWSHAIFDFLVYLQTCNFCKVNDIDNSETRTYVDILVVAC